jgi:PAS domain S-box-containing protein
MQTEAARQKLILLVEDEAIIALAETFALKEAGFRVEIASSGEAALNFVESKATPDLVLMDINLGPGMDGTEAAAAILSKRNLPIVFLTSHSSAEMVRRVRGITRYGYVIKNSGSFVLLSSIEMAFELFAKEKALEERNRMIERAEEAAQLGYWYVTPGSEEIRFSPGGRAILGLSSETYGFEEFRDRVLAEDAEARERAFAALVEEGEPYDITYRVRRADTGAVCTMRSSGKVVGGAAMGVIQDVSAISRLLGELRESEARQAVTLRSIGDGVISTDLGGRVVEINRMAERLTGWSGAEAAGRPIREVFPIVNAKTREAAENPIGKVLESGYMVGLANHTVLIARDGSERHIADSAAPILDERGAMLGVVLVFRDVTEEYLAREQVLRDALLFKTIFEDSHTAMLLVDPESGAIRGANRAAELFYGWGADELRAMNIAMINTLPPDRISEEMRQARDEGRTEFRFVHRLADGGERHVLVVSGPVRLDGETLLFSIVRDASELVSREREILALRRREGFILSDARHRMKNNVQMIASLVGLQESEQGARGASGPLAELRGRIAGMALIYEHLYVEDDLEYVGSRDYLVALLRSMKDGFFPRGVVLGGRIEDLVLSARFAVSIGLIVGELVLNACKYAFPSGRGGMIAVFLSRSAEGALELRVRDDGVGMVRAESGGSGQAGLGLELASSIVAQEGGELRFEDMDEGTSILCAFPAGEDAGAARWAAARAE